MTKVLISKEMLDKLEYGTKKMSVNETIDAVSDQGSKAPTPTVLFVFAGSDLNAAAYHLAKSLESTFAPNAIATVIVQESIRDDFIAILKSKIVPYAAEVKHAGFLSALEVIKRMKAKTVVAKQENELSSAAKTPTVVCDVTHEQLGVCGGSGSGVVTLHTFRTAKEAIALCTKEPLSFVNASIWNENHACAYEIVAALSCKNFFINCYKVSLEPLKSQIEAKSSYSTIEKSYHYENLLHNGHLKSVIFPIGTIFAN